jgi:hypothetical protein
MSLERKQARVVRTIWWLASQLVDAATRARYTNMVLAPNLDGWTLVLAGFWNPAIFRPAWVGERLFRTPVIETLVPLAPGVPVVFRSTDVAIRVSPMRLEIMPRAATDAALAAMENIAVSALEILAETPVSAVGVNFAFREDAPGEDVLNLFNFHDAGRWGGQGWQAQHRELSRKFERNGQVLNLRLGFDGVAVDFNFNFNFDVETARAAIEVFRGQTVRLKTMASMILDEVYELQMGAA